MFWYIFGAVIGTIWVVTFIHNWIIVMVEPKKKDDHKELKK